MLRSLGARAAMTAPARAGFPDLKNFIFFVNQQCPRDQITAAQRANEGKVASQMNSNLR